MSITAKIIADSKTAAGIRITTFELRYPRFIHAEFMTHRVFSRNAASSRAIPTPKMLADIMKDMASPIHWGANQSGMQAAQELTGWRRYAVEKIWRSAGYGACALSWLLFKAGAHKQIVNRITEPFSHITVVVTSTQWNNFFALRNHPDAQPEIHELAKVMFRLYEQSYARPLDINQWHLPYVAGDEREYYTIEQQIAVSVARCASTSYKTVDGKDMTGDRAVALNARLLSSAPLHASPAEHQARPDVVDEELSEFMGSRQFKNAHLAGNLYGMIQYRKTLPNENNFDY